MSAWLRSLSADRMEATVPRERAVPALLTEDEFHALYARTAAPLRAYIARTVGNPSHADDIVQETFLRLLVKPVPTRDVDALRAYVFRIASNLVIDQWRARKHETTGEVPERSVPASDHALRLDVGRLFARLKPRERQLVWLAHVDGQDHREIAETLGLGAASIRVLLSRARRRLATMLREHGHDPKGTR